jgi:hypothetical protein
MHGSARFCTVQQNDDALQPVFFGAPSVAMQAAPCPASATPLWRLEAVWVETSLHDHPTSRASFPLGTKQDASPPPPRSHQNPECRTSARGHAAGINDDPAASLNQHPSTQVPVPGPKVSDGSKCRDQLRHRHAILVGRQHVLVLVTTSSR